jgi:hypothetical protein
MDLVWIGREEAFQGRGATEAKARSKKHRKSGTLEGDLELYMRGSGRIIGCKH